MALLARHGLFLPGTGSANGPLRTDGVAQAIAAGQLQLASTGADAILQAGAATGCSVRIGAGGASNVLQVTSNAVVVYADLQVLGAVDRLQANDLYVTDRVLALAAYAWSNATAAGGGSAATTASLVAAATEGAGVLVAGDAEDGTVLERSLRWRGATAQHPAGWEARGGAGAGTGNDLCLRLVRPSSSAGAQDGSAIGMAVGASLGELVVYSAADAAPSGRRRLAVLGGRRSATPVLGLPRSLVA